MSDWSSKDECLIDPMCGSGTLPIEAALIAGRIPPGLFRSFEFEKLPFFEKKVFEEVKARLQARIISPARPIFASDIDEEAVRITSANAERAGVLSFLEIKKRGAVAALGDKIDLGDTLVICNPPYGKRIGNRRNLRALYRSLGDAVRRMPRTRLAFLTGDPAFVGAANLSFDKISLPFPNGGIRVRLFSTGRFG
jgi:putative N6-adenine-specific DNA methylase